MVAYAKENQKQPSTGHPTVQIDKDVICPKCFKPLQHPVVTGLEIDRYKREMRTYYGWCFECEQGYLVIQFKREDRWVIHKYREAVLLEGSGQCCLKNNWRIMNELPEPALIVVGPGGDYDKQITPEVTTILKSLQNIFEKISQNLKDVLEIAKQMK